MKIEITDDQINLIMVEELYTQRDFCAEDSVKEACRILLEFYGQDPDSVINWTEK